MPSITLRAPSPQPQDVAPPETPRPKSWTYRHRAQWARSLPVKPGARLTAVCIADHINERSGAWIISAAQLGEETGQGERTVRRHITEDLRAHFTVQDRPGYMWRFTMPAALMQPVEPPRPNCPDPPAKLADVPSNVPSERKAARARCLECGHNWPAEFGADCHECIKDRTKDRARRRRSQAEERHDYFRAHGRRMDQDDAPRVARPDSPPLTPERRAAITQEYLDQGWKLREGRLVRF